MDGEPCVRSTSEHYFVSNLCVQNHIHFMQHKSRHQSNKKGLQQQEMAIGAARPNSVVLDTGAGVAMLLPFPHYSQQFVPPAAPYYNFSQQLSQPTSENDFGYGLEGGNSSNNIDYSTVHKRK